MPLPIKKSIPVKRKRPSVTSQVEKELRKGNPKLEFAFVKATGEKARNVTRKQFEDHVSIDTFKMDKYIQDILWKKFSNAKKTGNYKEWNKFLKNKTLSEIHTHIPDTHYLAPSISDIVNVMRLSNFGTNHQAGTIFQTSGTKVLGRIQFTANPKSIPTDLKRRLTDNYIIEDEATKIGNMELVQKYHNQNKELIEDYLKKARTKMQTAVTLGFREIPKNRLEHIKSLLNGIGLIAHYIPNKGYYFDKEEMNFKKIK